MFRNICLFEFARGIRTVNLSEYWCTYLTFVVFKLFSGNWKLLLQRKHLLWMSKQTHHARYGSFLVEIWFALGMAPILVYWIFPSCFLIAQLQLLCSNRIYKTKKIIDSKILPHPYSITDEGWSTTLKYCNPMLNTFLVVELQ